MRNLRILPLLLFLLLGAVGIAALFALGDGGSLGLQAAAGGDRIEDSRVAA